ncbi:nucleotide exchange factor GrpE [Microbacterium arborescens]|jgi:molecular chaperone GrpE|uniref:nucleotide exchange factor GrpE n=1 Tax=Microbacterium arborescens TaxID=33883 RepID=UPI0025A2FFA3|nr:nucleotide exchange factor GrpE [Microbacterium arborescens]MDF2580505.1 nucleotide exchange factor GrpE [Microbacterium sp.]WJM16042.1 nucleotide exchange factor GrpE [Microbacterium arborescens]
MTNKDFEEPHGEDEVLGGEGSDAQASGPDAHEATGATDAADAAAADDELTIDDILGATQSDEAAVAEAPAEEHDLVLDLKRVQAEYANYRRRTEEQREVEIERAKGSVAKGLLPVLDDLDRADKHGDLVEGSPLAVIADKLRGVVARLGVESYGAAGDAFDPQQHEAIFQAPTPGTAEPTILEVVEVGYRLGSIELRPAKVVVAVPAE